MLFESKTMMAQTNWENLPYKDYADFRFQPLNKSNIPTGILYDRVMPISQIDEFVYTGATPDTTHSSRLKQAYYELYNANYNNTKH